MIRGEKERERERQRKSASAYKGSLYRATRYTRAQATSKQQQQQQQHHHGASPNFQLPPYIHKRNLNIAF